MAISEVGARAALDSFVDPYLQQSLGEAQAVRALELSAQRLLVRIELGYPTVGYAHALQSALQQHLEQAGLNVPLTLELS
ncbi:MAG: iron-sulfur cluster assembly protein, partial [Steroidobacteraceae bacterium]